MKARFTLIMSAAVASAIVFSSSGESGDREITVHLSSNQESLNSRTTSSDKGKFAPKFDGLRFIETLVTAHR